MIEVVMLVATLIMSDGPPVRVVSADWPYFNTFAECQRAAQSMRKIPRMVDTVVCERSLLDPRSGKIVNTESGRGGK